jgi:hypothetical protein
MVNTQYHDLERAESELEAWIRNANRGPLALPTQTPTPTHGKQRPTTQLESLSWPSRRALLFLRPGGQVQKLRAQCQPTSASVNISFAKGEKTISGTTRRTLSSFINREFLCK